MAQSKSLSAPEVAELLHVSKSSIYEMIKRGEINSYKVGRKVRFTQDDVDAYIARSRHEQSTRPVRRADIESSLLNPEKGRNTGLIISGQDVLLDILANHLQQHGVNSVRSYLSGFEGLLALYEEKTNAAACHLYDAESGEFNTPFVKKLMPGIPAVLINLSYRTQGLYVKSGNPKGITGIADLARKDVSFINRRPGSASRILTDGLLHGLGITADAVNGYDRIINSHLTVAAAIAAGEADAAIGTERVSKQIDGLDFVPILEDRVDLVVRKDICGTDEFELMADILSSTAFRREIACFSGNDYRDTGKLMAEI